MFIRILKHCVLGKPGRSIMIPTQKQAEFAARNPTIARLVYEKETKILVEPMVIEPVEPVKPVAIPMVDPVPRKDLHEEKHGKKPVEPAKKKRTYKKRTYRKK